MSASLAFSVRAPAKINIRLVVGGPGADGFHPLRTVFQAVDLYDTVTATPSPDLTVTVAGPESAGLADGPDNIAWRAARLLADTAGVSAGTRLVIDKQVPIAAGLAGGSADAAATLLACNALWQTRLTIADLTDLAAQLGSDVPFALHGHTALGSGRGEHLQAAKVSTPLHWVLAASTQQLSTPAVYRELDRLRAASNAGAVSDSDPVSDSDAADAGPASDVADAGLASDADEVALLSALATGDMAAIAAGMRNDLQQAALSLAPQLAQTLHAGLALGALAAIVSGSGPTCAFLATDADAATSIAAGLVQAKACRRAIAVTGNVAGAAIVED